MICLAVFILICCVSYAHMTLSKKAKSLQKFVSFRKFPIVGSLLEGPLRPQDFAVKMENAVKKYGTRFVFWVGNYPYMVIADASGCQKILSSSTSTHKGHSYSHISWLLKRGLLMTDGEEWLHDRKLLNPSFKYQNFDGFLQTFNKKSQILVNKLNQNCAHKSTFVHPYLSKATMDTITECALGIPGTFQEDEENSDFATGLEYTLEAIKRRINQPYLAFPGLWKLVGMERKEKFALKAFSDLLEEAIRVRQQVRATEPQDDCKTRPFLDYLLDTSTCRDYISGHINTIFGAGFETTATSLHFTLYMMALHKDVQEKVHAEIDAYLAPGNDAVTSQELPNLKYLEMCIRESLRLFPSAPTSIRQTVEEIMLDDGTVIPKGIEVVIPARQVQMDPVHFPDPEKFDPDRFLPDVCASRNPYAWIPFSAGPRLCIGYKFAMVQLKIMLAHILRKFNVSTNMKLSDLRLVYSIVIETNPRIEMMLTPR